ncbi:MAG TPA: isocitrate/isopropylmalate dehydrogenase family protein [Candidatus Omnitrophota bacterium]|nr:isocitrate/isopropylmalate dehydrogenase family protein [Candidatus Omnitrophota bacterium]HPB69076.1 isocitrate/isopropylmalate dehydrogenase family protein [Candidatus Omnitrophota bacterium]HQO57498.1 isocitrate/isopropylmalate dehydrogenase family protein [Candidatus Omnitrophota bacterium]HQP12442.1 isocitrate/isopropylmalate dehydrogenase family protein [Candidatus Omnitrophota bacterium]
MSIRVTLLPGDGIGPEVSLAMKKCVEATGVDIEWEEHPVGEYAIKQFGTPLPEEAVESIRRNTVAIKGPIVTPVGSGFRSVNVQLRQVLDLFACVRPNKYYEGTKAVNRDVDLVIFRENTEDLYAGIEFEQGSKEVAHLIEEINRMQPKPIRADSAISIKPISVTCSRRIVKAAFDYAVKNNRKKVSAVHKANIMKYTDGLFLQVARDVAKEYEGRVEFQDVIVDNMCMQLVQKPDLYDVLVLPNLYGDIVSDLCAGLVGGLGIAPGANIGENAALFEPVHGSAPKYAGKNKVNPTATILSAVMMLRYLNKTREADRLEQAVQDVLREGKSVTYDLKAQRDDPSAVGTQEMADAICQKLH